MINKFLALLLCCMYIVLPVSGMCLLEPQKDKLLIEEKVQTISFEIINGKVEATLDVRTAIRSKVEIPFTYGKSLFFDGESEIIKIVKKEGRRNRKIKTIVSDYESNGIFHSDLKVCYFEHEFSGSEELLEFYYVKSFKDLKFLDPLFFNDYYEILESKVIIEVPKWLNLDLTKINFDNKIKPNLEVEKKKESTIYTFTMKDVSKSSRYKNEPRSSKVQPHLILIAKSFKLGKKNIRMMEDVSDLYKWYRGLVNNIGNKPKSLEKVVNNLIKGKSSDEEKIKEIYYWVQDNIRYIAFEDGIMGYQPESCQDVMKNRYGDCKGMANLLKNMLTIAGYDARLTWLGTNDKPYTYDIPSLIVDNHMICTLVLNEEYIFLDATETYGSFGDIAYRLQGKEALIEDGDKYIVEKIPSLQINTTKRIVNEDLALNDEVIVGEGKTSFIGNRKTSLLYNLSSIGIKERKEYLESYLKFGENNTKLSLLDEVSIEDRDQDMEIKYKFSLENHIVVFDDEIYVNLEHDYLFQEMVMPDDRKTDFEFRTAINFESVIGLEIPEGWKVNYLPESVDISNDKYSIKLNYRSEGGKIVYTKEIKVWETMLKYEEFDDWNKTISSIKEFYGNQIIFKK